MKLKEINELTGEIVEDAAFITQEVYDIYIESDEVEQLTISSKQVEGVLTMARASTYSVCKLMYDVKLLKTQKYLLCGAVGVLGSYYVYNEFIKDSKLMKKIKNKKTK